MNDVSQRNEQVALWALRALWIGLPITLGPLLATKLDPVDLPGRSVLSVGLWLLWGLGFFSTLLPRPATLTAVRFGSAALIGLIIFAAGPALDASLVAGAINVLAALLISASAPLGGVFVDGVSYGDERRFLLRAPALVAILLRPLALIAGVVGLFTGPWLLANRHLISGFIFLVIGWPVAALVMRSLHQLNRRWVVLVPAGLVLHDHLSLNEPTLFQRHELAQVGPAASESTSLDLTQGAYGLALEVRCATEHDVWPTSTSGVAEATTIAGLLCAPARPDALLAEAAKRKLPVG